MDFTINNEITNENKRKRKMDIKGRAKAVFRVSVEMKNDFNLYRKWITSDASELMAHFIMDNYSYLIKERLCANGNEYDISLDLHIFSKEELKEYEEYLFEKWSKNESNKN